MNEVTQIHLGRQAFTISVEAHSSLKHYLAAITKQVEDKSVVDEVELRMAELLNERGIKGDKTVLMEDIDFLKSQLGNPKDFKESDDEMDGQAAEEYGQKRLYRNTDNAMIAGVASGLANYFGIDVVLIRALFIIAVVTGGWGILVYIVLWLVVPEAKTSSEKLRMQGKPVTVDALKDVVERADLKGAANRVNSRAVTAINAIFKLVLRIIGLAFIITGLMVVLGLITGRTYMSLHHGNLFQEQIFPVGTSEQLLLNLGLVLAAITGLFIILFGLAMFRRKWPVRAWVTGTLIGVFLIGSAASVALSADAFPKVRARYRAATHTTTRALPPFTSVSAVGDDFDLEYEYADTYSVDLRYFGNPDISKIRTDVVNNVLEVNARDFDSHTDCYMVCMFPTYNMRIVVRSPSLMDINHKKPVSPPEFQAPALLYQ